METLNQNLEAMSKEQLQELMNEITDQLKTLDNNGQPEEPTEHTPEETTREIETSTPEEVIDSEPIETTTLKADFEIKLDEMYSIRLVANELIQSIPHLENSIQEISKQLEEKVSMDQLEVLMTEMLETKVKAYLAKLLTVNEHDI